MLRVQAFHVELDAELIFDGIDHFEDAKRVDNTTEENILIVWEISEINTCRRHSAAIFGKKKVANFFWSQTIHSIGAAGVGESLPFFSSE